MKVLLVLVAISLLIPLAVLSQVEYEPQMAWTHGNDNDVMSWRVSMKSCWTKFAINPHYVSLEVCVDTIATGAINCSLSVWVKSGGFAWNSTETVAIVSGDTVIFNDDSLSILDNAILSWGIPSGLINLNYLMQEEFKNTGKSQTGWFQAPHWEFYSKVTTTGLSSDSLKHKMKLWICE